MRYVVAAASSPISIVAVPAPPASVKSDVLATIVSVGGDGVATLSFPAYDAASQQAPDETRIYAIQLDANGAAVQPVPIDGQGWVDSGLPVSVTTESVGPEGQPAYIVQPPAVTVGLSYCFQIVHGFNV